MTSPTTTLIIFSIATLSYFVLYYYLCGRYDARDNSSLGGALLAIYLAIIFIVQLISNMNNIKEKCGGTPQRVTAFNYTAIPNLFIFGTLLVVMMFFPGWKAPFSNTLGYGIVRLMGVHKIFTNMLKDQGNNKLLQMVYKDPSMMINEITPENFDLFINRMEGKKGGVQEIIDPEIVNNSNIDDSSIKKGGGKRKRYFKSQKGGSATNILNENYKNYIPELYNLVFIKDKASEFIWYVLTGALVIFNSHTYVLTTKCERTSEELSQKLEAAMNKDKKQSKKDSKGKPTWTLGY